MTDDKDIRPFLPPVGERLTLPDGRSRLMYDKENRTIVPIVEPAKHRRCLPKGECAYCDAYGDEPMMPRHYASQRCESGKRPHCTCDICF